MKKVEEFEYVEYKGLFFHVLLEYYYDDEYDEYYVDEELGNSNLKRIEDAYYELSNEPKKRNLF